MQPSPREQLETVRAGLAHYESVAAPAYESVRLFYEQHCHQDPRRLPVGVRRQAEQDALRAFYMLEVQRRLARASGCEGAGLLTILQETVSAVLEWLETGNPVATYDLRDRFNQENAALVDRTCGDLQGVLDDSLRLAHEVKGDPEREAIFRREVSPIRARVRVLLADLAFFRIG